MQDQRTLATCTVSGTNEEIGIITRTNLTDPDFFGTLFFGTQSSSFFSLFLVFHSFFRADSSLLIRLFMGLIFWGLRILYSMVNSEELQFVIPPNHFSVLKTSNDTKNFCIGMKFYPYCVTVFTLTLLSPTQSSSFFFTVDI